MKRFLFQAILLMPFLVACQSEWAPESVSLLNEEPHLYYASIEQPAPETKVYADSQMRVLWNANDSIAIFEKNAYPKKFRFQGQTGDNAGTFQDAEGFVFYTGNELDYYYAVYPYAPSSKLKINNDGDIITLSFPEEQTYLENSFGIGANTMISVTNDMGLKFKNVCGYLCFKLYGEGVSVSRISLKGNTGQEIVSGNGYVTVAPDADPVVSMDPESSLDIALNCPTPVALGATASDYKEFWLALPPTTYSDGFTLYVWDQNDNQFSKSTHNQITIQRNHLVRMAPIQVFPGN